MTWYGSPDNQAAAEAAHVESVTFVVMDLPSGVLRLHTRVGTIRWNGDDWIGVGKLGAVSDVQEDALLRPSGVTLTLSGVDVDLVSAALFESYHGRTVAVYVGLLDAATLTLVADPQLRFSGLMDTMAVEFGEGTGTITVRSEGDLARWSRHNGLLYSHESQVALVTAQGETVDRFFDQMVNIQNRTIDWTKKSNFGHVVARAVRRVQGGTGG